jgi:biopolymer transport protein ExbB
LSILVKGEFSMLTLIRRLAVGLLLAAAVGLPLAALAQDAAKSAPAAPAAPAAAPAPAAPVEAPAAVAPTVAKESVANPYGLEAMWKQGDFVSRGTMLILVLMSMGSWYIIIVKLIDQYKLIREGNAMEASFWKAGSLQDGANTLKEGSAYRYIAETGLEARAHREGSLIENIDPTAWVSMQVQRAVDTVQSRLQGGLAFLATVGSTAPFVGLFGTVWGIYHALTAIGIAGQASIDKVAGPVGEALIMTAIGLAVAVPAVLFYNWLVRRNKVAIDSVRTFGADLNAVLLSSKKA